MFTKLILPVISVVGMILGIYTVSSWRVTAAPGRIALEKRRPPVSQPIAMPPTQPAGIETLYGAGLVEAQRENIPIGTVVPGVVTEVHVDGRPGFAPAHKKVGDHVTRGEPLFRIDDRDLIAELRVREAALKSAEAQLNRLRLMPRDVDVPPAEAAVKEAEARLADAEAAYKRDDQLYSRKMLSASDWDKDRYAVQAARATLTRSLAELKKLEAGAWEEDIRVQEAAVEQARSQIESMKIQISRLVVRAPVDGEILQVNVRPGQFAAMAWKEPMVVLGEVNRLHVRVDIDEIDLNRFREGAKAWATLKGRREPRFNLEFFRVEPYVIPKRSLTGDNSERVDTRALQVLYALPDDHPMKIYVGQQMDVFLSVGTASKYGEGPPPPVTSSVTPDVPSKVVSKAVRDDGP